MTQATNPLLFAIAPMIPMLVVVVVVALIFLYLFRKK